MRQVGTLPSETHARTFENYLLTRGMKASIEAEDDQWAVWIHEEDQLDPARQALQEFSEDPDAPVYREAAREADRIRKEEQRRNEEYRKKRVDVRRQWERPLPARLPVTTALIGISTAVTLISGFGKDIEPLVHWLGFFDFQRGSGGLDQILQGQIWRLVTPIFIHLGLLHLVFNMYWTYALGGAVERYCGAGRYVLMVLVLAATSNVAQYMVSGPAFGGMSGVVYGVFGYVWMKGRYEPESGLVLHPNVVFLFVVWLVVCMTGVIGNVANTAHVAGLIGGVCLGYAPVAWREMTRK